MKSPILGSAYVARSTNAADNRMVNLYPEVTPDGGKESAYLLRCPGLRLVTTVGAGPVRGLWALGNAMYVVSGTTLYQVTKAGVVTSIGTVANSGPVSMADNGTQIFIAANPQGYIYNSVTNVFTQIVDPDFPGAVTVGYLDGYFVFNEPNSQKVWVTSLYEGTEVDPLEFASAEGSPDGLVSVIVDHREAWLFGSNSVEVWYDAGTPDFPLQRIQGAFNEIGCAAPYSVAKLDNGIFWLGSDARGNGIVYRSSGYAGTRISTHAIEYAIQSYGTITDAIAYTYQQDGHAFYVLVFPSASKTWVFDVATGAWHERASFALGEFARHRSNCQVNFDGETIVGDYADGRVYAFDLNVYSDDDAIQKWLRSWRALPSGQNNLKRTTHHSLQLDCESGVGLSGGTYDLLATEEGDIIASMTPESIILEQYGPLIATGASSTAIDPQVMLRWSDDGGHKWSNEHWRSMGAIGATGSRVIWRRLGMTMALRDRVYELSGTDPVKVAIMGAELILSATNA